MSKQDASGAHGNAAPPNKNNSQETPESSNKLRFTLLFISIIISLLIAPFFLTDNIFNICVFFATFTTLIFALTDLIIYLLKESPSLITPPIDPAEKDHKTNKNPLRSSTKKVVHYIQRHQTRASRIIISILKNKWLTETLIIVTTFPVSLIIAEHWKEIISEITTILELFTIKNKSLGISILATIIVALIKFRKRIIKTFQKFISSLTSKYFVFTLASLAIIGASSALLIPSYTNWFREPGYTSAHQESAKETPEKAQNTPSPTPSSTGNKAAEVEQKSTSDLRLHLLYITGGIIAILGLLETNRKNSQDHIRQVHAARRDRYIEAVDKLSSDNAPVRLGGIYALVGLIDEWLDDDNIDEQTRVKEGQIIINNLCSYIRSPYPLAEKINEHEAHENLEKLKEKESKNLLSAEEFLQLEALHKHFTDSNGYKKSKDIVTEYAKFREEQDVRRTIFIEMHKRSSTFKRDEENRVIKTYPGPWSNFEFDFSQAQIFYPLNSITIEKGFFLDAKFYTGTDFSGTTFTNVPEFFRAIFTGSADFSMATFASTTSFFGATFSDSADFNHACFTSSADFSKTTFNKANFHGAKFHGANFIEATFAEVDFGLATFTGTANFYEATFSNAKFNGTTFTNAEFLVTTFTNTADFSGATFTNTADFCMADFNEADFGIATFTGAADFSIATFTNAEFLGTTFTSTVDFSFTTFTKADFSKADFSKADFSKATISTASFMETNFTIVANFRGVTFAQEANFFVATFASTADFSGAAFPLFTIFYGATFAQEVSFNDAFFEYSVLSPFAVEHAQAQFSLQLAQEDYDFSVHSGTVHIQLGKAELDGIERQIPVGTVLFDPDSWDEEKQEYTRVSKPAK